MMLRLRRFLSIDYSLVPPIVEADLKERFVTGSGPGGSAVNKSRNAVSLKHLPTGIVVKCHQQRTVHENQKIARKLLQEKLDNHLNGDMSVQAQKEREQKRKLAKMQMKKSKLKHLKEQWKINENLT